MEDQLISFETAKLAKEKGFDEWCANGYNIHSTVDKHKLQEIKNKNSGVMYISAPTQSLLQRWLREKHKIYIELQVSEAKPEAFWCWKIFTHRSIGKGLIWINADSNGIYFNTYEESLEKGLQEALKLIEK